MQISHKKLWHLDILTAFGQFFHSIETEWSSFKLLNLYFVINHPMKAHLAWIGRPKCTVGPLWLEVEWAVGPLWVRFRLNGPWVLHRLRQNWLWGLYGLGLGLNGLWVLYVMDKLGGTDVTLNLCSFIENGWKWFLLITKNSIFST